jgi:hypothetical protein
MLKRLFTLVLGLGLACAIGFSLPANSATGPTNGLLVEFPSPQPIQPISFASAQPVTLAGGFTHIAAIAAATTGPTPAAIATGPGLLGTVVLANSSAAVAYLQIFDAATGSISLGTTKPDRVLGCAAATTCYLQNTAPGTAFTTAITWICCTTTATGSTGTNVATIYAMADHK